MIEKHVRPVEAVAMATEAAVSLAIAGIVEAAKAPLVAQVEDLQRENAALASALEVAEQRAEMWRRAVQDAVD